MGDNRKSSGPSKRTALFYVVAGGTGGHILPGISVGEKLEDLGRGEIRIRYISGRRDIERLIYREAGISPIELTSSHNPRRFVAVGKALLMAGDFLRCLSLFLRERPVGVLAMGGSVCFPVLSACRILGIPIFLHESNAMPGRVVRAFAKAARRVFLGLGGLSGLNVQVIGTPSRTTSPSADSNAPRDLVLCVGGSQGAARLNDLFLEAVRLLGNRPEHFILIGGPNHRIVNAGAVEVRAYEPELPLLWQRCKAAVTRSGSGTLADLANAAVPSLLVPYPHAMDDHQTANARVFTEAGAARLLPESMLTAEILAGELRRLLDDDGARQVMKDALRSEARPDAAAAIAREILNHLPPVAAVNVPTCEVSPHGSAQ